MMRRCVSLLPNDPRRCSRFARRRWRRPTRKWRRAQVALELAGAFSNDGFKLRDGHWSGTLAPDESKLIAVNLYAGNEYWFSAGATEKAKKLAVDVFDETGAPVVDRNIQLRHESGCRILCEQ